MPSAPDDEIDRLYQLPIGEFTGARNALAKRLGADGAAVRALEKPTLAAWAVNQLYWRKRAAHKQLIAAAAARRSAHAKRLSGKGGDVQAAESAYAAALSAAAAEVRAVLAGAGGDASSATWNAVTDTLQALPEPGRPGRLTRPLRLVGFEALAGLVPASERTLRVLSPPAPPPPPKPGAADASDPRAQKREADAKKRAAAARRRDRADLARALGAARQSAKAADAALAGARKSLALAKDERARLQDRLQFLVKKIDDASVEVRTCEERVAKANQEHAHYEAKLAATADG